MGIYSHSRLSCFEDCPRRFYYRYVARVPAAWESVEAFVGKRVHEVLERLLLFVGRGQVPSLPAVLNRYQQLWEEHFSPERVRVVRSETPLAFYREGGERCLANHYRRNYPFDADETISVEERVTCTLDDAGRYQIQGFVDRLVRAPDGALEIHDYKTSRRIPTQKVLDEDRQLALYQLAVERRFPEVPGVRLVWHYLYYGEVRISTRSADQLKALRERTLELIDSIEREEEFAARPNPLCQWCEYREGCPASSFYRAEASLSVPPLAKSAPPAPEPEIPVAAAPSTRAQLPLFSIT